MSPAAVNEREELLAQQIEALELVLQGLDQLFFRTSDPDVADDIRLSRASVRQRLFTKQAELDSLNAAGVIPPVSAAEREAVAKALNELNKFVIADQTAHIALDFLTQIAERVSKA